MDLGDTRTPLGEQVSDPRYAVSAEIDVHNAQGLYMGSINAGELVPSIFDGEFPAGVKFCSGNELLLRDVKGLVECGDVKIGSFTEDTEAS
jgi:hypothetical protein